MSTFTHSKHRNVKKSIAASLAAAAMVTAVGSFALFTDRAQSQATVTTGTLDLQLTQSWNQDNEDILKNFVPGDVLNIDYTLANKGNLSTDIKETFVITSSKVLNGEFELYAASDVHEDATTGLWVANDGADPIEVRTATAHNGGTKITYEIPEYTVNGTGENAETESGITSNQKVGDYVLLFNKDSANTIQGTQLNIEYVAQGLQHRNTGDDTWEDAKVISESITIGGTQKDVVPQLNAN